MDISDSDQVIPIINHQRSPSYAELQPSRNLGQPKWKYFMYQMDIFAFLPTPRTYPVSTKRSLIGSFLLFVLFFGYILYSFIDFLINNVPRVNEFTQMDNSAYNTTGPQIAIQFLWGKDAFDENVVDPSYFTISMQEVIKYLDPSIPDYSKTQIPISTSCSPSWIPTKASNFKYTCPTVPLNLSGQLYQTEKFIYPRIQIDYCKSSGSIPCKSDAEIEQKVAGGRLFLYVQNQGPDVNYATGKETNSVTYQVFQYFLVPTLYNRAEIVIQKQNVSITGNYLTSFRTVYQNFLTVSKQYFYVTNVSVFDRTKGFQIFIRLDQELKIVNVVKMTIVDVLAKWGAFWGVIFAAFAFYFLRFNQQKFYTKNPEWNVYDETERTILQQQNQP